MDKYIGFELVMILVPAFFSTSLLIKKYFKKEPVFVPYYSWDKEFGIKVLVSSVIGVIATKILFSDFFL